MRASFCVIVHYFTIVFAVSRIERREGGNAGRRERRISGMRHAAKSIRRERGKAGKPEGGKAGRRERRKAGPPEREGQLKAES